MRLYIFLFLIIVIQSCAPTLPARIGKKEIQQDSLVPPFSNSNNSMLFKAHFQYGKKIKIGGLLLIKQTKTNVYRVLLMAELGATLFDFEFGNNSFKVHRSFEALNRPIFLKIIENDIKLLLMQRPFTRPIKHWQTATCHLYRSQQEAKTYTYAQKDGHWDFFQQNRSLRISFQDYPSDSLPQNIKIQHYFFPLQMELEAVGK